MRIWHQDLIPKLCRQHLLAMWREGLGAWSILEYGKKGYKNHPAVKEFRGNKNALWHRLLMVRAEMIKRSYNPKPLPYFDFTDLTLPTPWQTLEEQKAILKQKGCECKV